MNQETIVAEEDNRVRFESGARRRGPTAAPTTAWGKQHITTA